MYEETRLPQAFPGFALGEALKTPNAWNHFPGFGPAFSTTSGPAYNTNKV